MKLRGVFLGACLFVVACSDGTPAPSKNLDRTAEKMPVRVSSAESEKNCEPNDIDRSIDLKLLIPHHWQRLDFSDPDHVSIVDTRDNDRPIYTVTVPKSAKIGVYSLKVDTSLMEETGLESEAYLYYKLGKDGSISPIDILQAHSWKPIGCEKINRCTDVKQQKGGKYYALIGKSSYRIFTTAIIKDNAIASIGEINLNSNQATAYPLDKNNKDMDILAVKVLNYLNRCL